MDETKKIRQDVDFSTHLSGASTVEAHVISARRCPSFSFGAPSGCLQNWPQASLLSFTLLGVGVFPHDLTLLPGFQLLASVVDDLQEPAR